MSSVIEQYAKQKADKAAAEAADAARREAKKRDLDRARELYATGEISVSRLAEVFNLDAAEILQA